MSVHMSIDRYYLLLSDVIIFILIRYYYYYYFVKTGTSDNCSVSSDISERTGTLDNESEKSYTRISSVSVVSINIFLLFHNIGNVGISRLQYNMTLISVILRIIMFH